MTDGPEVLYEVAGHIATITLNRPERMNTISRTMLRELTDIPRLTCPARAPARPRRQ
jgi:enoyl-CoA hydratase/carnithine racemase